MHELSVASAIYDWAVTQLPGIAPRRLVAIELQHDALSGLNTDSVDFGFQALAAGTELRSVKLEWREVEPTYICPECREGVKSEAAPSRCPYCRAAVPRLGRDDSVRVRSIEVE